MLLPFNLMFLIFSSILYYSNLCSDVREDLSKVVKIIILHIFMRLEFSFMFLEYIKGDI